MEKIIDISNFNKNEFVFEYAKNFKILSLISDSDNLIHKKITQGKDSATVNPDQTTPYQPELNDLCRLHWLATSRKSCQVLEFGSGYSTLILASAMKENEEKYLNWAQGNLRIETPFQVISVEESIGYLELTKSRLGHLENYSKLFQSDVYLTEYRGKFVTFYERLPNVMPDLIYLDGPSQYAANNSINGFSVNFPFRMPMAADLVRMEYFLEPGALIIVDGRGANAAFLRMNLERNWRYLYDQAGDIHLFELQDEFIGDLNKTKFNFCLENGWLIV